MSASRRVTFAPSLCKLDRDFSGFLTSRDGQAGPGELYGGLALLAPTWTLQIGVLAPDLDVLPGIPKGQGPVLFPALLSESAQTDKSNTDSCWTIAR